MSSTRSAPLWQLEHVPLWVRLVAYATEHADDAGTVWLEPGQLRLDLGSPPAPAVSKAIRRAELNGHLRRGSSARVLWLEARR